MKQVIQNFKTGELKVVDVPVPSVGPGGVLVRNQYSLVSAGTEKMVMEFAKKSLIGKAKEKPELVKQVISKAKREGIIGTFRTAMSRLDVPMPLGYSSAGIVTEVGENVDEFKPGDRVACAGGGYATHSEVVFVPKNLCAKVPENVDFESAAFTTLGAIALQGVRRADITPGENVAVIGLGLLGQLTVQILKAFNCRVIGIDIVPEKVKLAQELGADCGAVKGKEDIANAVESLSNGYGADAVIITVATSSSDPVELAGEISRDKGRIVLVGVCKIDIPRKIYYEKELDFRLSRSYGPGRYDTTYEEKGVDYPIGYVRWTEKRNMEEFLKLLNQNKVKVDNIITHRFKIEDAEKAYELITKGTEKYMGILLEYPVATELSVSRDSTKIILKPLTKRQSPITNHQLPVTVGLIGAGNFAKAMLLPNLKKLPNVHLKAVADIVSANTKYVGAKFGFEYCTSNYQDIMKDSNIDTVIIATRHNLHSKLVIEGLKSGKNVFVEKPLALTRVALDEIIKIYNDLMTNDQLPITNLMVGFNRRFSPFTQEAVEFFAGRRLPMCINYCINAGFIPKDNWVQDIEEGGGRIIGEVCHFVDFLYYLIGSKPIKVYAEAISSQNENITNNDHLLVTLKFEDGSIGEISYFANGDKSFPKERVEIFCENSICIIKDFRRASFIRNDREKRIKRTTQDKGHFTELKMFFERIQQGKESPISFEELVITTDTTFKITESLNKGTPMQC